VLRDFLKLMEQELVVDGSIAEIESGIEKSTKVLIDNLEVCEEKNVSDLVSGNDEFIKRNRQRWKEGFKKLLTLRMVCLEAGINFQKLVLAIPELENDELIGVLMRQHAHACRISGEIIHLLEGGYPDAALARWRTLFEIAVTSLVIKKYGREAAIDYIKHGMVKNSEGIEEHKKTAVEMNCETFTDEEVARAKDIKTEFSGGEDSWHWARKYVGASQFGKLRDHVGLGKWSHNYKLASRNIHSDYFEMTSMLGMREATSDALLTGQSNSGFTDPAHFTAISLSTITSTFITAYIEDESSKLDYSDSLLFLKVIEHYVRQVGESFLKVEKSI
jgi:hypothetical protein